MSPALVLKLNTVELPTPLLKLNTVELPTPLLKLLGCISYLKNFTHLATELLLFTVTT
jgi:hypothetical protein